MKEENIESPASMRSTEAAPLIGREGAISRIAGEMLDLAYRRIIESASAFKVKVFKTKGDEIIYSKPLPDFAERREAAELILTIADHKPRQTDHDALGGVTLVIQGATIGQAYGLPSPKRIIEVTDTSYLKPPPDPPETPPGARSLAPPMPDMTSTEIANPGGH